MIYVTDWKKYAPYITKDEMKCSHTGRCNMRVSTMDRLLALRLAYAKTMNFTSGDRDPSHPIEAAKEDGPGIHTKGCAVDISVLGADALELFVLARKHGFTGFGVKQNGGGRFLHFDDYEGDALSPRPWIWSY